MHVRTVEKKRLTSIIFSWGVLAKHQKASIATAIHPAEAKGKPTTAKIRAITNFFM